MCAFSSEIHATIFKLTDVLANVLLILLMLMIFEVPEILVLVSSLSTQLHEPKSLLFHPALAELLAPDKGVFGNRT